MYNTSLTHKAKKLYEELVGDEPMVGHSNIDGKDYWVSKRKRAYLVQDMPTDYIADVIRALRERHPEVDYSVLKDELKRRTKDASN